MAYVVWRVLMKKYSRVRLGLHKLPHLDSVLASFSLFMLIVKAQEGHHHHVFDYYVTPTGRHCVTYDDESWKATEENPSKSKESSPDIARSNEVRQSKTKRVKNYLKKCKNALGSRSSTIEITSEATSSSWYVDQQINESEINEIQDEFQECVSLDQTINAKSQVATLVEVKHPYEKKSDITKVESAESLRSLGVPSSAEVSSSPLLPDVQESVEGVVGDVDEEQESNEVKNDVASLVDRYFGALYENYKITRKCLVRQARDLLVCEYHGCLQKFEEDFCEPAAVLLQHVKNENVQNGCSPQGWPLSLGDSGLVIHLGPLTPTLIRNKDCYVCIRNRSAPGLEVAVVWRKSGQINCRTLAEFKSPLRSPREVVMCSRLSTAMDLESYASSTDDCDGVELPELLQNLLVSIEHVIQRVPLDDLTFPCPQCLQYLPLDRQDDVQDCAVCSCQCSCRLPETVVLKKDTSIQTSPMFEFAGSIPHIDSDEDDDKVSIKSGSSLKKSLELVKPRRITELPEKLLMSGINLPGTVDVDGRPVILCYAECITRAGLNKYEVAKLILYYASVSSAESISKGFTVLLLAETEDYNKVLELLDKAAILLGNFVKISKLLVWRPGISVKQSISTSRNQVVIITDESSLGNFIKKDQAPASCGGECNHDQLEWVEFFKQLEPFLATCRAAGRALLSALSQLRNEDVPLQVTRRFLNHQCRQISRAIQLDLVQKLRRDGHTTLTSLEERTQWLSGSRDVRRSCSFAAESFSSVNRVAKRLEQLAQERKERLKELARLRSLQDEIEEVLLWINTVGEETLGSQVIVLRTSVDVRSVKAVEKEFEKFYFSAMKQIDKASDLIEESTNIVLEESRNVPNVKGKSLKESANNLKAQVKTFGDRLEEIRECLEACSRCFQLLDSCHDILEDDSKEQEEFTRLAFKSGNEKLIQICKSVKTCRPSEFIQYPKRDRDELSASAQHEMTATSTPIKSQNTQIRRRSVSSHAFIYKCNHHAAGVSCNCCESDTENTVSYKLKKKYMQTLQSCPCNNVVKDTIERKNSVTLDGIKEVRESVENLLEKLDKNEDRCGRCDSGVSTADNSVGDDSAVYKKNLQRTCSCQFYRESCVLCSANSSSTGSNQDHTENQQDSIIEEGSDGFVKSGSDDIEDEHFAEARRKVPPVPSNSHLHCHSSTFDLPTDAFDQTAEPKTLKTLLYIMREMIQTERDYVSSLDYVIENYIPELLREDIPQALRGQRNVVFGNIEKIFEFHSQHFLRELEQCELQPLNVGQIFLKYQKKFYLYALYNKNKPKSDSLMSEYGSTFFKSKQIQLGDKMDLASYLLKPVQRMGKYALLLQQMMKACPALPPGASERAITEQDDLKQAEQMVRFQLRHGNDLLAMDSIRECDVNLKEQGRLLRQSEFLLWEGKTGKKSLRQVFLFEELILFSKARRFPDRKNLDLYIYKNSIKMTDIGLTAKIGESPTKFEIWFRKRKPNDTYILQSMNEEVKKAWSEELSQLLWKQAIRNREARMAEMSSMGIGNKPCLDIRPSADQINDRSISFAQLSRTAPRFRNSIVGPVTEQCRSSKRPHSVISMSSVSSGSTSSGSSSGTSGSTTIGASPLINVGFDPSCDSPKPYHRSGTLNSQCSTESGIIADISLGSDDCPENQHNTGTHWSLEKSNSQHSNISQKSTSAQSDDTTQVSSYHMQDEISINM